MATPKPVLEIPAQVDAWSLVDWVETTMVLEQATRWTKAAILTAFPSGSRPDAAEIDEMLSEIERRSKVAPDIYPFRESDGVITVVEDLDSRLYEFLVLISVAGAPFRKKNQFNRVNPSFDLIVREAAREYFGAPDARAVRFAWPTRDNRPTKLKKAMPWLARKLGLNIISLNFVDDADKDAGVDVVAWRPFAGGGGNFACALMQNTLALDYRLKPADIAIERWKVIIHFGSSPMIGLAVPFAIDVRSKVWQEAGFRADLVFERLRLCQHVNGVDFSPYEEWAKIAAWNSSERKALLTQATKPAPKKERKGRRRKKSAARRSG